MDGIPYHTPHIVALKNFTAHARTHTEPHTMRGVPSLTWAQTADVRLNRDAAPQQPHTDSAVAGPGWRTTQAGGTWAAVSLTT